MTRNDELKSYPEVWTVQIEPRREPGERPKPISVAALEVFSKSKRQMGETELAQDGVPYPFHTDALYVTYDAPAALGCHLALGWPLPSHILDLHAEFRRLTSGHDRKTSYDLASALEHYGLGGDGADAIARLLDAMSGSLDLPRALLRGRYTAAVARMEAVGVPIDVEYFNRLRTGWDHLREALITEMDRAYGVFKGGTFCRRLWAAWVNRNHIPWPRKSNQLDVRLDVFREMAMTYPEVLPMKELRASLSVLRDFPLAVGTDGRNRCRLNPFASKTGRNQPGNSEYIFGPAVWVRGLIKPAEGRAVAYVDYEQQEFGIGAALSGDQRMMDAYRAGDPYLEFAKQAGHAPPDATKSSHKEVRERFKQCALGTQYGMRAWGLSKRLGIDFNEARRLLDVHKQTYSAYWRWSNEVERRASEDGELRAAFGWTVHADRKSNTRSLRNFPLQANGAEMLRLACIDLTERGIAVCAPVHDALLIEAPIQGIEAAVTLCKESMRRASEAVLGGFSLRTEEKVVRFPDRYMDARGERMWDVVSKLLEREPGCLGGDGVRAAIQDSSLGRYTRDLYSGPASKGEFVGDGGKGPSLLDGHYLSNLRIPQVACPSVQAAEQAKMSQPMVKHRKARRTAQSRRWVDGDFIKGPIPVAWLRRAADLPGRNVLLVAFALWHLDGMRVGQDGLKLTTQVLAKFGVTNRQAKYQAIAALEGAGLIQVRRQGGKNPVATLMEEAGSDSATAHTGSGSAVAHA